MKILWLILFLFLPAHIAANNFIRVAMLDPGHTEMSERVAAQLWRELAKNADLKLLDRAESRAAARGADYNGSLNLTLDAARDLGAALGCDFYLTGDAQVIRRSASSRPVYYEAYASIFLVSTRTGKLLLWDRPSSTADAAAQAEKDLFIQLTQRLPDYAQMIRKADRDEPRERAEEMASNAVLIEDVPDETATTQNFRPPQPYRRLRPKYPDSAARAEVDATVDALVWIDAAGEVSRVEIVRWAGFGLDEETVETIRRMHFRPAMRDGEPVAMRALLRYNFRRPPKPETLN